MIRRLPTLGLVLLALSGFSAGAAVASRQAVSVGTNGALASPTNFFRANIGPLTNALSEVPIASPLFIGAHSGDGSALSGISGGAIDSGTVDDARIPSTIARAVDVGSLASNRVSKAGDTMTGTLGIRSGLGVIAMFDDDLVSPGVAITQSDTTLEIGETDVPLWDIVSDPWLRMDPLGAQFFKALSVPTATVGSSNDFAATTAYVLRAIGLAGVGGGGTGNADTNAPNAWAAGQTQTFLGPLLVGNTNLAEKLAAMDSSIAGKQAGDSDLDAVAGLATSGIVARTGAGTAAVRTLTGDAEIVVANGNGVSGNPTLSIGAAIARVAAIAAGYQPLANILTRLSGIGLGVAGDLLYRDANGWTNLVKGADGKVLKLIAGFPAWADDNEGGGGGGDVYLASPNVFTASNQMPILTVTTQLNVGVLHAASAQFDTSLPITGGGHGGTTVAEAQTNLLLVPGLHVQAQNARLQDLAVVSYQTGDMVYYDGANLVRLASTADGRALLVTNLATQKILLGVPIVSDADYGTDWTNSATTVPSRWAVWRKIESMPGGTNAIQEVNTNYFSLVDGYLDWAGGTPETGDLTDNSDVTITGPAEGEILRYDGSEWRNARRDPFDDYDDWQVVEWNFDGSSSTTALEPGLSSTAITGGAFTVQTNYFGSGTMGLLCRTAANDTVGTGASLNGGLSYALRTNVNRVRFDAFIPTANAAFGMIGFSDNTTLGDPSDALGFTLTNMVVCPVAISNSTKVVSASTFTIQPNVAYSWEIRHTNTSARFLIWSNSVAVSDLTLTTGIPINATNLLAAPFIGMKNNSTALTNSGTLVVVDRARWARKLR